MKKTVFILISVILVTASLEASVRVFGIGPNLSSRQGPYGYVEHLPFRIKPASITFIRNDEFSYRYLTNSEGLTDTEHKTENPDGNYRILALGDSFTQGIGAPQNASYPFLLEEGLNKIHNADPVIEVIKAGVMGYSAKEAYLYLKHYGIEYKPQLITVGFTETDLYETLEGVKRTVTRSGHLLPTNFGFLGDSVAELLAKSRLLRTIAHLYKQKRIEFREKNTSDDLIRRELNQKGLKRVFRFYTEIKKLADSIEAEFIVIGIPLQGPYDEESRRVFDELKKWCVQNGIGYVDVLSHWDQMNIDWKDNNLYWKKDGHCTTEGYKEIAKEIFKYIVARDYVKR